MSEPEVAESCFGDAGWSCLGIWAIANLILWVSIFTPMTVNENYVWESLCGLSLFVGGTLGVIGSILGMSISEDRDGLFRPYTDRQKTTRIQVFIFVCVTSLCAAIGFCIRVRETFS